MSSNGQIILESWWFPGGGVVLVQDEITFEYKAYVKATDHNNGPMPYIADGITGVEADSLNIASWGTKIPKEAIKGFFPGAVLDETKPFKETNPGYLL